MAVQGVLIGASIALPLLLEWYGRWKGDPEADALQSLQRLQQEQEQELLFREQAKVGREEELTRDYSPPAGSIMKDTALLKSGYLDEAIRGSSTGSLSQAVATKLGIDPEDLRARLSPRRLGNLSDMAASVEDVP